MATYSPFNRIINLTVTKNGGSGDTLEYTTTKKCLISIRLVSNTGSFITDGGFYFGSGATRQYISWTDSSLSIPNEFITGSSIVPSGVDIRCDLPPNVGVATFDMTIIEID